MALLAGRPLALGGTSGAVLTALLQWALRPAPPPPVGGFGPVLELGCDLAGFEARDLLYEVLGRIPGSFAAGLVVGLAIGGAAAAGVLAGARLVAALPRPQLRRAEAPTFGWRGRAAGPSRS